MSETSRLVLAHSPLPEHETIRLLALATGSTSLQIRLGIELTPMELRAFEELSARRRGGEPLQYIEGSVPFGPVIVSVDERVLVPRPETEELFEIVSAMSPPEVVVDLCTGSGNLALALASTFSHATVLATDISSDAVAVATDNARRAGLDVTVLVGDLFDPLPPHLRGQVDLIVANPPYLAEREYADLPEDVRREPMLALVAGPTGLEVIERIAARAPSWLRPGGTIVCEVSEFHAPEAAEAFCDLDPVVKRDLGGKHRFIIGHRSSEVAG
jgi:release factor glutamine methyltransferase